MRAYRQPGFKSEYLSDEDNAFIRCGTVDRGGKHGRLNKKAWNEYNKTLLENLIYIA